MAFGSLAPSGRSRDTDRMDNGNPKMCDGPTDQPTSDIDPKSPTGDQCGSGELVEKNKKEVQFEKYISHISRERLNGGLIREIHFSKQVEND